MACGDLNIDFLNTDDLYTKSLHNFILSRSLSCPITTPTRISVIAVPNRTQITCKHCLTTPVALPCTVPVFPLLLPCGMILACLHFLHTESFTLLNSCSNATIPLLLPIYLLFSMNHLTGTLLNSTLVNFPPVKSSYGQHTLSFLGVSLWRSLPLSIRNSDSLVTFTRAASAFTI